MLAAMGGLPFARPDQHYEPPAAGIVPGSRTGIFRGRLIVIAGGSPPAQGVYVYTPSVAAGNLIASVANGGTDTVGNHINPGLASYSFLGTRYVSIFQSGGQVSLATSTTEAGPYTVQGLIGIDASTNALSLIGSGNNGLILESQGTGQILANSPVQISAAQSTGLVLIITNTIGNPSASNVRIVSATAGDPALGIRISGDTANRILFDDNASTGGRMRAGPGGATPLDTAIYRAAASEWASDPIIFNNAGAAESWQTVGGTGAAFAGTWANAASPGVNLKYRRNAAPFKSVHWVGRVTNTVAQAAGSAITAAVASAYQPSNTHDITCFNLTSGAVVRVSIGSTGILTCQSAIAANDVVSIPDVQIGLDA